MYSVMANIAHLCTVSEFGPQGWRKVVICIVSDGRETLREDTREVLKVMGLYQDNVTMARDDSISRHSPCSCYTYLQDAVGNEEVSAHIFEYTTQSALSSSLCRIRSHILSVAVNPAAWGVVETSKVPCQVIFCLKERNQKKINSHRWFFNAFCPILKPTVCVLLDVGTEPGPDSLYHLWKAFIDPKVAGACGEIVAYKGQHAGKLLNPIGS